MLTDENGSYVLTAVTADGQVTLTRTPVEIGVSDGIYTAVSGIEMGASVVDNAENYAMLVGQTVPVSNVDMHATGMDMMSMMMGAGPMGRM